MLRSSFVAICLLLLSFLAPHVTSAQEQAVTLTSATGRGFDNVVVIRGWKFSVDEPIQVTLATSGFQRSMEFSIGSPDVARLDQTAGEAILSPVTGKRKPDPVRVDATP